MSDTSNTPGAHAGAEEEPIGTFDETNGLVDGLEGDDGGAQNPNDREPEGTLGSLLGNIESALPGHDRGDRDDRDDRVASDDDGRDDAVTNYSEEGTP